MEIERSRRLEDAVQFHQPRRHHREIRHHRRSLQELLQRLRELDDTYVRAGVHELGVGRVHLRRPFPRVREGVELRLAGRAARLLEEALIRGEIERGEIDRITGLPERSARRVLSSLIDAKLLASDTEKGPVSLRFPDDALEMLFPRLYPAAATEQ